MGLDMYLNKAKRLEDANLILLDPDEIKETNPALYGKLRAYIVQRGTYNKWDSYHDEVGYWRKANQIHNWFVKNVQGGEDECNPYEVSRGQIKDLLNACRKVQENHSLASKILPTCDGFFFGCAAYDEYYYKEIDYTIGLCEQILEDFDFDEYVLFYRSSW